MKSYTSLIILLLFVIFVVIMPICSRQEEKQDTKVCIDTAKQNTKIRSFDTIKKDPTLIINFIKK